MKLLSPKPFADYAAGEFHDYVRTLYREPPKAEPLAEFSVRLNSKLNPVITIRRDPKFLTSAEVSSIAADISWPLQRLWLHIAKKKIEIQVPKKKRK